MSALRFAIGAVCLAAIAAAAVFAWSSRVPDVEVRTQPWRTHSGAFAREFPVGQGFACEHDGLHRIDVAVGAGGDGAGARFELSLRERTPQAEVVRRTEVAIDGVSPSGDFLRFEFEPLPDSAGKNYFFEIAPAESTPQARLTPFVIFRGQAQDVHAWGDHVASEAELEGTFVCEHPDLRGIAVGMVALDPSATPAFLELWREGAVESRIARVEARPRAPIQNGWAFFPFPVVKDIRWKTLRYRLFLPAGARANANAEGLALVSYHGGGAVSPRLLGMTVRGEACNDRDVVFKAWTNGGVERTWTLLRERAGWALLAAVAVWIAGSLALLGLVRSHRVR